MNVQLFHARIVVGFAIFMTKKWELISSGKKILFFLKTVEILLNAREGIRTLELLRDRRHVRKRSREDRPGYDGSLPGL